MQLHIHAAVLLTAATCGAIAQPIDQHQESAAETFPPDALPVPGVPGAMTHRDVPPGWVLVHGDIQVKLDQYLVYLAGGDSVFGDLGANQFWPLVVPFGFNSNVTSTHQIAAIQAMDAISARTGLSFVPHTNQNAWIQFNESTGNNSPVGMPQFGGQNTINLANWGNMIVICHEIYHSLGFWHQQSAPNRNTYITVNLGNVCSGFEHNFDIRGGADTYGGYDFDSFMHYPRDGFSCNGGDTITVNQPWTAQWQNAIGQRSHFSYYDEITCRGIYRRVNDRWWQPGVGGTHSGNLLNPLSNSTFASVYNATPAGGTLFIKNNASYPAVGTYSKAMIIEAPTGATLGN